MDPISDKEERKREYNRLAQREFRRRRKEHLKSLELAQREQNSEQSEEIRRLRAQNAELRRENDNLRAQIYGSPTNSHIMTMPSQHDSLSRSYSSSTGSPLSMGADMVSMNSLDMTSEPPSMSRVRNQPYPVQRSGSHRKALSLPGSSGFGQPRSAMRTSFQPMSMQQQSGEAPMSPQPGLTSAQQQDQRNLLVLSAMVPYDRSKARAEILSLFAPLSTDASISSDSSEHLAALKSLSSTLPDCLKPTESQLNSPHYFGIDFLASPTLRDRLMGVERAVSESFLADIGMTNDDPDGAEQLRIWGDDSLNEMSWEFSRQALERWGWLLGRESVTRSNFWRRQRRAPLLAEW